MSAIVETWLSEPLMQADCGTCGEKAPRADGSRTDGSFALADVSHTHARDRFRKWARKHATDNPGHLAVVEVMQARCYRAAAAVTEGPG